MACFRALSFRKDGSLAPADQSGLEDMYKKTYVTSYSVHEVQCKIETTLATPHVRPLNPQPL